MTVENFSQISSAPSCEAKGKFIVLPSLKQTPFLSGSLISLQLEDCRGSILSLRRSAFCYFAGKWEKSGKLCSLGEKPKQLALTQQRCWCVAPCFPGVPQPRAGHHFPCNYSWEVLSAQMPKLRGNGDFQVLMPPAHAARRKGFLNAEPGGV